MLGPLQPWEEELMEAYKAYRRAPDPDAKGEFFSPECMQICRQHTAYAARDRATIVRYLKESARAESGIPAIDEAIRAMDASTKHYYTMRGLPDWQLMFNDGAQGIGMTEQQLIDKAKAEHWRGMRVDLWTDDGHGKGLLVKVHYWWRREDDGVLRQIMHHILYIGPRDGTEGLYEPVLE